MVLEIPVGYYLVDITIVAVEPVIGQFVMHPQKDEDAAGHPDGKAQQVAGGKTFVTEKVPPGYLKIILKHAALFRNFLLMKCRNVIR
jgi:hypothetical protein